MYSDPVPEERIRAEEIAADLHIGVLRLRALRRRVACGAASFAEVEEELELLLNEVLEDAYRKALQTIEVPYEPKHYYGYGGKRRSPK